jgi:hypothetical protein
MAQVVSHQPLAAEFRVRSQASLCKICGGQSGTGSGFSRVLRFPVSISVPMLHTHLFLHHKKSREHNQTSLTKKKLETVMAAFQNQAK